MPLAAEDLLDPACPIKPAWAKFDAVWYVKTYPQAGQVEAALGYYLGTGARHGHSPSPLFDEAFYLTRYPDIAELVRSGAYASGFDHYCQHGHRAAAPHWLFDDTAYGRLYEDMSLENLGQHGLYGRYDHYLKSGQHEGRLGHFLFDPAFYQQRAIEAGDDAAAISQPGPYVHFLYRLHSGLPELPPSIYFDPAWYAETNPGLQGPAIQHYLCGEDTALRDPVPEFKESFYLNVYKDIAAAVENGYFRSGYQHFVQYGAFELRQPCTAVDLVHYRNANPSVRDDLNTGAVRDAFAHLRLIGFKQNLDYSAQQKTRLFSEEDAKQLFRQRACNQLALSGRRRMDFTATNPVISVIVVLYNKFELTMLALASLRHNFAGEMELIIADNGSTDGTRFLDHYIAGATILRLPQNEGFIRAANLALEHATAPALLYLNNDTELDHNAIAAALARLQSAADIGAVGGKILRSHGLLQEAGSIIWNDGNTQGYLRDASPLAGEANFVRDVDYCSAVFLLCRTALVKRLNGFDPAFVPAYYEDTDLCVRLIQAGYRIVYDPAVVVHHLEFGSTGHSENAIALMRRALKTFQQKHENFLQSQYAADEKSVVFARSAGKPRQRVLYIDDTVPLRHLGSGFARANAIVCGIVAAGFDVTVFPVNGAPPDLAGSFGALPERVEILHDRDINGLAACLQQRPGYYDLIWISRTHNLARVQPVFRALGLSPPVVLDTEAIATLREAAQAELSGFDFNFAAALREEFAGAKICRQVLAVNQAEVELLRGIGLPASLLGTPVQVDLTPNPFAARSGLLFAGAIHQRDSPNLGALHWFVEDILPALKAEMGEVPVLHVAGYAAADINLAAFKDNPFIKLHGAVADLRPLYNAGRVFIAPARLAAGTPYKIYHAAANGVPCVATDLLAEQLGWRNGIELLGAPVRDAKAFAAQIAALYQDATLWRHLRDNAAARLGTENNFGAFNDAVKNICLHQVS
jgi:GT2 family glycosyltransferase